MSDEADKIEINSMLLELLDGKICDERFVLLGEWLGKEPGAVDYYSDFMKNYAALCHRSIPQGDVDFWDDSVADEALWQMLAESEKSAATIEIDRQKPQEEAKPLIIEHKKVLKPWSGSRLSLYTAIISTAALIFILLYVISNPRISPSVVAKLTDAIDAKWGDVSIPAEIGDDLRVGPRQLLEGLARIDFDDGAQVVIQAPAEFSLESTDQLFLFSGRLTCRITGEAGGFIVRTPSASIVDYGTEFGVTAKPSGETEAHVFEGSVELRGGSDPVRFVGFKKLTSGMAGMVDERGTVSERTFEAQPRKYIRQMPDKQLFGRPGIRIDLADIVGGGNGFGGGKYGFVLDPISGGFISFPELKARGWHLTGDGKGYAYISDEAGPSGYVQTSVLPYIDGIFVPDGGSGEVQVSSQGHVFKDCPDTGGGFWAGISNHGRLKNDEGFVDWVDMRLGGTVYGSQSDPGLFMHANIGITFDLEAIRESLADTEITCFKAMCGILRSGPNIGSARFYVVVDGAVRYDSNDMSSRQSAKSIDAKVDPKDRFLTLVTTDANRDNTADGCVFALPRLELAWKGLR